ncbi:MAG: GntR family transcriptional regulator [Clostridiales Family XIII bacterium]|jgi:DNA-binding GntR family transcriptional regulator|nr:GntR family transcriptional regulator [Clostridiales Family XIII bacterium]
MIGEQTLPTALTAKIREDILKENLPPGAKLIEKKLGEQYGVSRTPIREALRNLTAEGLVEWAPNRGVYVIGLSGGDVSDLFQLRKIHEVQATEWAVERIYKEELDALEESYEYMAFYTKREDTQKMRELNANFHRIIREASHNRLLADILSVYRDYWKHSALIVPYRREHLTAIFAEHTAVFEAFIDRDPRAGGAAMEQHIARSAKRALRR